MSAALGFAMAMPALTGLLSGASYGQDIEARGDAAIDTMERAIATRNIQANVINEQSNEIDREVGDMMTQRGLQAMQAEATLRAGAAETGTSGGTTQNVIKNAYMTQALDNAITIGRARKSKLDLERRKQMLDVSLENELTNIKGGLVTGSQAALGGMSAGIQGFSQGYSMLSTSQKDAYFS